MSFCCFYAKHADDEGDAVALLMHTETSKVELLVVNNCEIILRITPLAVGSRIEQPSV
jgi:hypothetical protein